MKKKQKQVAVMIRHSNNVRERNEQNYLRWRERFQRAMRLHHTFVAEVQQ